jgi:hypothetical protein
VAAGNLCLQTIGEPSEAATVGLQLEEYKSLSREIQARMKELGDLERYSLIGVLGFYAWLITHSSHTQFPTAIWCVPVAVALFIVARTIIYSHRVNLISKYIADMECQCGLTNGYETKMQALLRESWTWRWSARAGGSTAFVWLALLAGTVWVALCHGTLFVVENIP